MIDDARFLIPELARYEEAAIANVEGERLVLSVSRLPRERILSASQDCDSQCSL